MKIFYKIGDLLDATEIHILHGCNAQGVYASGVAGQIRKKYPEAYNAYIRTYDQQNHSLNLGQTIWVQGKPHTIINGITQEFYGRDSNRVYVDYENGIRKVIKQINSHAYFSQKIDTMAVLVGRMMECAMPLIGAGLANGSWKIISQIIEEESTHFQPVVYLSPKYVDNGSSIRYDTDNDSLVFKLSNEKLSRTEICESTSIVTDYDEYEKVVAYEVMNASENAESIGKILETM